MRSNTRSNRRGLVYLATALLAVASLSGPLAAQNNLTGTVVDAQSQRPLPGAQVLIDGSDLGGLTDNRGRFLILNAPSGTVTVGQVVHRTAGPTVTGGWATSRRSRSGCRNRRY